MTIRRPAPRPALLLLVALCALLGAVLWPAAASAHSVLESTSPASGETVATVPDRIVLTFNEPVNVADGAIRLLDVEGDGIEIPAAKAVDATVTVDLPTDLGDGSYVVAWKVMSADSHPVSGAYTFAIGAPSVASDGSDPLAAAQADESGGPGPQVAVDVAAALAYAGVLLAVGVALFIAFVGTEAGSTTATGTLRRLVTIGAGIGGAGLGGGVVAAASQIDGGWPSGSTLGDELTGSPGLQALLGVIGLGLLLVAVNRPFADVVRRLVTIDGAVAALAAFVIVGHTRTAAPVALTMVVDVVHLAAAAVWTGGLVALLVTLRSPSDAGSQSSVVARFSGVATVAIVAVAFAGAVLGWRIVGSWSALTGTTYGVLLMVKVGLFVVLAAVGGFNKFRLVDRVAGEEPAAARRLLRRTLGLEVLLVVAIVGVTGSFTSISPEQAPAEPETTPLSCAEVQAMEGMPGMETMDHETCTGTTTTAVPFDPTAGAGPGGVVTASDSFGDGLAVVRVTPASSGSNTVSITLTDADGNSVDPEEAPTVQFRLRAKELGPISVDAERVGPGAYRVVQDFVLPGEWEINVSAVLSDFEQPQAVVDVTIAG